MRVLFILLAVFFLACNNDDGKENNLNSGDSTSADQETVSGFPIDEMRMDSSGAFLVWYVNAEDRTRKKNPAFDDSFLDIDVIIQGLNQKYPKVKLNKLRISGDTLYTEIRSSEYLGQEMGSFGAEAYLADAAINLTSPPQIQFLNISMNAGSHVSPGVWSEQQFADYKEIK